VSDRKMHYFLSSRKPIYC